MNPETRILHMYHDLMNLYGDWANVAVLERELALRGFEVVIEKKSVGDGIDFDGYHAIIIGSGTERSQQACMQDLAQYKYSLIGCINAGTPVLATGSSHELFGWAVTDSVGNRHEMLGLLDFETVQLNTRVTGDCVFKASFLPDKLIGFINRAGGSQKGSVERPFSIEPREGASYAAHAEGIHFKNLLGTYMTGPLLFRNPPFLKYFADIVVEKSAAEPVKTNTIGGDEEGFADDRFFVYQQKAYEAALSAL